MTSTHPARSRRAVAYGSAALVLTAAFCAPAAINAATGPESMTLAPPAPTGPHAVGRSELHLSAPGRGHPWVEEAADREVMVSLWYPAVEGTGTPAPYLTPSIADALTTQMEQSGLHRDDVDADASRANARQDARVDGPGPYPVVLYSPGFQESRFLNTANIEELASHGYVVAAMDHPYETLAVDMPDGRVLRTNVSAADTELYQEAVAVRTEDARLVLDGLAELAAGGDPGASGQEPPAGLGAALDMDAVGMFGHSAGGLTSAEVMLVDDRVDAGMDLDGTLSYHTGDGVWADSTLQGADRPFALLLAGLSGPERLPHHSGHNEAFGRFVEASSAPVLELYMADGEHMSYTDRQWFLPAIEEAHQPDNPAWEDLRAGAIGTVDPEGAVRAQRAYVTAFFDAHLRGADAPVLHGPSPELPEMEFIGRN